MKKKWLRRAFSAGLALVLTLGLCACGGEDTTPSGTGSNNGGTGGKKDPNAALAKENVYKYQEFAMPELEGDSFDYQTAVYRDGMVYMVVQVYDWTSGNGNQTKIITMKPDGSEIKVVDLEQPQTELDEEELSGETTESGGVGGGATVLPMPRLEVAEPAVESSEAETSEAETAETETTETETAEAELDAKIAVPDIGVADEVINDGVVDMPVVDIPVEDDFSNIWENSDYRYFAFGSDGKLYANREYYYENYGGENYISINKKFITCWNTDGTLAWETEIEDFNTDEEWVYISHMSVDNNGNVNLLLTGDNTYTVAVTKDSVSEKKQVSEEVSAIFMNYSNVISKSDGTLLVTYYDENDYTKMYMSTYDPAADTISEAKQLPTSLSINGYYTMNGGQTSDLIYSTNKGVYTYSAGDSEPVQKMNFINSDLNISNFHNLIELDEKSFVGVFYENYGETKTGLFTYVAPEDIPNKSVMILAGNWIDSDLKQRVVEYNRNSQEYRIVVKEYDAYTEEDGWMAGYTQLNNDIITGNMPDILITDGLPVENYASKGWLADIKALIANDAELSQIEFVENVFNAYAVEGKLYYIIPNFNVTTVVGKSSIVGDRTTWTMADLQALQKTLPEGTEMFGDLTRDYFFNMVMQYCGSDLVDVETGKCDFNSENFIAMMEYAKSLPEELGEDYYGEDFWMTYESRYRENRTVLMTMGIYDVSNLNYNINGMFGEDVSYVGFPTSSGQGSYVSASESYAISSRSQHIDAAWDFMRYYLTDEYQSELSWGLSIHKNRLVEDAQEATQRPYYLDEEGNKVEYDDYYYMNGEEIKLDPMTQEQVDEVVELILSVDKCYYNNTEILNIINEEMGGFFEGQKPARDVAAIIQSRVQIYVDENR